MNSYIRVFVVCASLVLFGCKEPASPSTETTSQATPDASSVVAMPAVVVEGVKPTPANDKFPPGALVPRVVNEYCNIESVNDMLYQDVLPKTVLRNQSIKVAGWIVDKANNKLASDIALVIETPDLTQRWTVAGALPIARQDVSDSRKDFSPELLNSGFSFDLDLSDLAAGTYHVFLVSTSGNEQVRCDHSRQITIQ